MRRILITGANKGIGLATVRALLQQTEDTYVYLGSRDAGRGRTAVEALLAEEPNWQSRLQMLEIDVSDSASIEAAGRNLGEVSLYGIVNNAGIGLSSADMSTVVGTNTVGTKQVCDVFMPRLESGGRVVNVSSASAPNFVNQCSPERQSFFTDTGLEWQDIQDLIDEIATGTDIQVLGLGNGSPYGFSKACVSLYTMILARENPALTINACTPGYIETDLTRPSAEARGISPAEAGMKPVEDGTKAILFLLLGQPHGSGHYYGSDAKRSPLDRYRSPGDPEYTG